MEELYKNRLIKLATYLKETSDDALYIDNLGSVFVYSILDTNVFFEARYYGWALLDLPWVFHGWEYSDSAEISYIGNDLWTNKEVETVLPAAPFYGDHINVNASQPFNSYTVVSCMQFFGIDLELFLHFFGENYQQPEKYGGTFYPKVAETKASHIASNIFSYLTKIEQNGTI